MKYPPMNPSIRPDARRMAASQQPGVSPLARYMLHCAYQLDLAQVEQRPGAFERNYYEARKAARELIGGAA